jgi:Fur family transcriptional regulator, ferric uptake regulator
MKKNSVWPKNLKRTSIRLSIYDVIEKSAMPLSVLQISSSLKNKKGEIWPSTVYRNLQTLEAAGLVRQISFPEIEASYYELSGTGHGHYAVCLGCHKMILINNCPFDTYHPDIDDLGFKISGHRMEIFGYCSQCQKDQENRKI